MTNQFDRIEAHLRAIFEENLPRIFTGHQPHRTLLDELVIAMQTHTLRDESGQLFAPDLYSLSVASEDMIEWQLHRDVLNEIAESIYEIGRRVGLVFVKPPQVKLTPDAVMPPGKFEISAHFSQKDPNLPDTAVMTSAEEAERSPSIPDNASLIIAGKTHFTLSQPIINIGRHSNNDLVLSDLHVSRHHAQLRAIKGHYVIFDVGSTGGVYINGKKMGQATLHAGDVIRIGPVNLIYNQEPTNAFPTSVFTVEDELHDPGADRP
jgi:hypothetical protein